MKQEPTDIPTDPFRLRVWAEERLRRERPKRRKAPVEPETPAKKENDRAECR